MIRIAPSDWTPADGMELEDNALKVVKEGNNSLVVAGPGAGKTELLAQKASFLLQTNTCQYPYKILAISFKRDAAHNLKERVKKRCGSELSLRFDSLTFDSFAKQLLDRFKHALPSDFKISSDYDVVLDDKYILGIYEGLDIDFYNSLDRRVILNTHFAQLPHTQSSRLEELRREVWDKMLNLSPSRLSFGMIIRLAEYIINCNPKIKQYLQSTYKYVFLDEFQDTTEMQYDLFKHCFLGGPSFYTAVGDDKQRIMLWAGAKRSVFEDFISDTTANRMPLKMNFRCAPRLVDLLNHLTEHLLGKTDFATASAKWAAHQGECSVWLFKNPDEEMQHLYEAVAGWIHEEGLNPRNICILVKQQLEVYAGDIIKHFNANGIKARNENQLQETLTQEISVFIIDQLYASFSKSLESKQAAFSFLANLHTEKEDVQLLKLEASFNSFSKQLRKDFSSNKLTDKDLEKLFCDIINFAELKRIQAVFPMYRNMNFFKMVVGDLLREFFECYKNTGNIIQALDTLTGKDTIPVMTIHKSKGLEYHTVIFVGLEDNAFWSFQQQPDEDKCSFFVALSRAKERVVFTFSNTRADKYGRLRPQSNDNIKILFDQLQNSGIVDVKEF